MDLHHTKRKADIGLTKVIADLSAKGHVPCIPLSEHQPYDIVVVLDNGKTVKVRVKHARLKRNGVVDVKTRSSWVDKHKTHIRHYSEKDFDYYAVYCPDKEQIIYLPNTSCCPKTLRFLPTGNKQSKSVKWVQHYRNIGGASETIRRTPETVKT